MRRWWRDPKLSRDSPESLENPTETRVQCAPTMSSYNTTYAPRRHSFGTRLSSGEFGRGDRFSRLPFQQLELKLERCREFQNNHFRAIHRASCSLLTFTPCGGFVWIFYSRFTYKHSFVGKSGNARSTASRISRNDNNLYRIRVNVWRCSFYQMSCLVVHRILPTGRKVRFLGRKIARNEGKVGISGFRWRSDQIKVEWHYERDISDATPFDQREATRRVLRRVSPVTWTRHLRGE